MGLTAELVIALTTVLPNAPVIPQWPVFVLFPGIFVVHLRSVVVLGRQRGHKLNIRDLLRGLPVVVRVAFAALFIAAWLVALTSILHIGGQPKEVHGQYYLNDHGSLIPATHSEYLHALVLQQRIFTLIPAVFYALGVIVNWPARLTLASHPAVGSPTAPGFAALAAADHHEMSKDAAPSATNVSIAFGATRRRPRLALIAWVLCLMLAYVLYFGLTIPTVRGWLHVGSSLPSCTAAGISTPAGREGKCARISGLFSSTVYNVVDRTHTLQMPEYQARLIGTRIASTRVNGPFAGAQEYPDHRGLLVSFEVMISNTSGVPLAFDSAGKDIELALPRLPGSEVDLAEEELLSGQGTPLQPSLAQRSAIPARGAVTRWATFVEPRSSLAVLTARPADLDFHRVDNDSNYVGQIRLWK